MSLSFPDIDPVAIAIGPLQIRWYALAYLSGILLGWVYALRIAQKDAGQRPNRTDIDDFIPFAVLGVILGGRLGYILFYQLGSYLEHPADIFKLWQGGMSFHGGALGVIVALIIYSLVRKIPLLRLSDLACASVPIGLFFGRIANFVNGELYGRVTSAPWGIVFPGGGPDPRHPSQLYEAVLEGIVLFCVLGVLIHQKSIRNRPGIVSGLFLIGYGLARMTVELFREPDWYLGFIFAQFTMGQLLCVPMIVFGAGVIAYALKAHPHPTIPQKA